ncbi:DUF4843 domain-containing protein [Pedobacter sp. AW31-3R]|uniref:DUF4843 domain-containing protein n=1 Tax=Pedobacter sp. AW31-3R TaxID=3445781 RepID=UPI003FA05EAF
MKWTINKIYLAMGLLFLMASCKEDEGLFFNSATNVYVTSSPDSVIYTFATRPSSLMADTVKIACTIMGSSSAEDRPITFVARDSSTAKANYHYKLLPGVVKANAFVAEIPVVVYRRAGLKDSTLQVIFDIKDNDQLKAGYPNRLRYKITLDDKLGKPSNWETYWKNHFGDYSEVKFRFLISATGRTSWNSSALPGELAYLNGQARYALLQYNESNVLPLRDEFGNLVFFP